MSPKKAPKNAAKLVPDFDLWAKVSTTVDPVSTDLAKELLKYQNPTSSGLIKTTNPIPAKSVVKTNSQQLKQTSSYELTGLDRRQQRKFLRGRADIDARIDLHGETLETARFRLLGFLSNAAHQNKRTVLVITGKGESGFTRHTLHSRDFHDSSPRTGRLRKALPGWLHEADFRVLVSGFQPAHPKHGGGGAVYIQLRNLNRYGRS